MPMFSLASLEKLVNENGPASKPKKSKRKRQLSSRESGNTEKKHSQRENPKQNSALASGTTVSSAQGQDKAAESVNTATMKNTSVTLKVSKLKSKKNGKEPKKKKKKGKLTDDKSKQQSQNEGEHSLPHNTTEGGSNVPTVLNPTGPKKKLLNPTGPKKKFLNPTGPKKKFRFKNNKSSHFYNFVDQTVTNGTSTYSEMDDDTYIADLDESVNISPVETLSKVEESEKKRSRKGIKKTRKNSSKKSEEVAVEFSEGENKSRLSKFEKREHELKLREERKALELSSKLKLLCPPQKIIALDNNVYLVVVLPGHSVYIHGLVSVQSLLGKVKILGYTMDEFEKQDVYSLQSHALLSIKALEGSKLNPDQHAYLLKYGISKDQLQETADEQDGPVVILRLQKATLPIEKRLSVIGYDYLCYNSKKGSESLSGMLVIPKDCNKFHLTEEDPEWNNLMEDIQLYYECGNTPFIVVCGGKGVGKSTFYRYVVNSLLTKKNSPVQCLDLDPGQSEFSLPSCLSLTTVSEPLLGPAYTHLNSPHSSTVKNIMIGGASPQFGLQRYLKALQDLFNLSQKHSNYPLVVNTMGWNLGTGFDIILDTIRIMKPSHVIQIEGYDKRANYPKLLGSKTVQNCLGGIVTKPNRCELHYRFTRLESVSGKKDKGNGFSPKILRELSVLLHMSDVLIDISRRSLEEENSPSTVIIPWPSVVLHICGSKVPNERILQVLNGNLVAFCQVDQNKVESISPDLPKHLIDDLDFGQCWGWGVVRGIDPLTKSLHILTSTPSEIIKTKVNAILMPEIYLPERFYQFFTSGESPYFQTMYRTSAGKLKIGRQIKPGKKLRIGQKEH